MSPDSTIERILELSAEAQIKRREAAEDSPAQLDRSDSGLWQNTWPSVKTQRGADETLLKQLEAISKPRFDFPELLILKEVKWVLKPALVTCEMS